MLHKKMISLIFFLGDLILDYFLDSNHFWTWLVLSIDCIISVISLKSTDNYSWQSVAKKIEFMMELIVGMELQGSQIPNPVMIWYENPLTGHGWSLQDFPHFTIALS